jgi:predicted RNA-binding protein associated with RNAse of E/G family
MDQILDIVVDADLRAWRWKDEDELQECLELGLISHERTQAMRHEGERVVAMLQSGKSIYNGWETWKPDPAWVSPLLPPDWDRV